VLLAADCEGDECSVDFIHANQPGVLRENFAFLCEVWWPDRPGNFTPGEQLLSSTQVFWGGLTTPLEPGDVPVDYCEGITPIFSADPGPNLDTFCGTELDYKLSAVASPPSLPVDGGTVSSPTGECSLLEAYDDVLVPAGADRDQCNSATCTLPGRQMTCALDVRISQVEDENANCGSVSNPASCPGSSPGVVTTAESMYMLYQLMYVEGDLKFRTFDR
jgi:hypothetical protein